MDVAGVAVYVIFSCVVESAMQVAVAIPDTAVHESVAGSAIRAGMVITA